MNLLLLGVLTALAGACAPRRARDFPVGVQGRLTGPDRQAASALGLSLAERAPRGADVESASSGAAMASWSRLRYLGALAAARGQAGVFFELPAAGPGLSLSQDFPEEWQALARAAGELEAMRPVLEAGDPQEPPFALPAGVEGRAWRYRGRLFVVLANASRNPAGPPAAALAPYRALFEVRADARQDLVPCQGGRSCLAPGQALWLEGRYR